MHEIEYRSTHAFASDVDNDLQPPTPSLNSLRPSLRLFTVASVSAKPLFLPPANIGVRIIEQRTIVAPQRKLRF